MKRTLTIVVCSFMFVIVSHAAQAGIYDFQGGIRIPAASCVTYSSTPNSEILTSSGGLIVYNMDDKIDISAVCQLPVPENVLIRQFVMVGSVSKGSIKAAIGAVRWNAPGQHVPYASVNMMPTTPYEIPVMKQKKVVSNLPVSGNKSLRTDRVRTYFIEARLYSNTAISIDDALEIFYFEVYWNN